MFGQWTGFHPSRERLASTALATLGPYQGLSTAELNATAAAGTRLRVDEGLLDLQAPATELLFLEHGSLQVQTHTGFVLTIRADMPQARYPVPLPPDVVSLYAAEPSVLLRLPLLSDRQPAARAPAPPALTNAETTALRQLAAHFRSHQCELPSLPDLALKIGRAIDDPGNRNEDIAELIQLDPALTARVLSVVNSAAYGSFKKVANIKKATTRLGRRKVRTLVYSCLIKSVFKVNSATLKRRMEHLWQHAVHVGALSFVLGRDTPGIDAEQALLAGLIHDIGSIAVIGAVGRFGVLAQRPEVLDYTIASLRVEVGVRTLRQWGLHTDFEAVIRDVGNWHRVGSAIPETIDVVNIALLHAWIGRPDRGTVPAIDAVPAFSKLARGALTPRRSLAILEEAEDDVQALRALLAAG